MSARVLVLSASFLLVFSQTALASPEDEAAAHKTLGKAAFQAGNFLECAAQYRASYQRVADANQLFNVGLCYEKAEEFEEALAAFREYLQMAPTGDRAGEVQTRIELLVLKIKSQASQTAPVVTPQPVATPPPVVAAAPVGTPVPQQATPSLHADNRAALAAPLATVTGATRPECSSDLSCFFFGFVFEPTWVSGDDGAGPTGSLDFRGRFGFGGGFGLLIGAPLTFGVLSDDEDSNLFLNLGFDLGMHYGGPSFSLFAAPGIGLVVFEPSNRLFDVRATAGFTIGLSKKIELRASYKRHFLAGLNSFGIGIGVRERMW